MKNILVALVAVILLSACARLNVKVDIYDPGAKGLAETATAQNFRAFAKFFADEESSTKKLIVQSEILVLEAVGTCFEGGDIEQVKQTYKKNFERALAQRSQLTKEIADIIANVLGQHALSPERETPSPSEGTKKSPTDTEIRVARLQIIPLLQARKRAFDPFVKVIEDDLKELGKACRRLAAKQGGEKGKSLEAQAQQFEDKSKEVEKMLAEVVRYIDQGLVDVAEVTTVIGGADPNAPRLVREDAIWQEAFNQARTFSGLSKSQFLIVQESLTDYRIKTVSSDPRQVFNTAMEIGKQVAKTVSAIYGFPLPTGATPTKPAGGTPEVAPETGATTGLMLDQQTRVLRAQEERLANFRRALRRDLESSLATLKGGPLGAPALNEARAKVQGSIEGALRKLEVELGVTQPQ